MCDHAAIWDIEVQKRNIHVPVCKEHKNDAAIELSRKGELILRPLKTETKEKCAYVHAI